MGYSTPWLALAAQSPVAVSPRSGAPPAKIELARGNVSPGRRRADRRTDRRADARQHLSQYDQVAFCFLDAEKQVYGEIYEMIVPRPGSWGGLLVADNAMSHRAGFSPCSRLLRHDPPCAGMSCPSSPLGQGELVLRVVD